MTTLFMLLAWLLLATGAAVVLGCVMGRLGGEDALESVQDSARDGKNLPANL